jgi:nicotinate-nucleotide adenylyltransferase
MRVGLFGGTFNPVHQGHLLAASQAMTSFRLECVHFIPNKIPPHRALADLDDAAEHRFAMLVLATACNPHFYVSRYELDRDRISYTVNTVEELSMQYPTWTISFITGADTIIEHTWRDFERLLGMLESFIVLARPGCNLAALEARLQALPRTSRDKIRLLEVPLLDVSSSRIRDLCHRRLPISYLVPREVECYISKHELYGSRPTDADQAG